MSASFLSAMDTRAEDEEKDGKVVCPVCLEECAKLSVTCCNGHTCCQKHFLQRAKAVYSEGRMAFRDDDVQRCFTCRTQISDANFSDVYYKNRSLVQTQGFAAATGIKVKNKEIVRIAKACHEAMTCA